MARETKAAREARWEQELADKVAAEKLAYPARLMNVLERASDQFSVEVTVSDGQFHVRDVNSYNASDSYDMRYAWDESSWRHLDELHWKLERMEEEQAEARRRVAVKKEAERKVRELLSDEERELLGL